MEWLRFFIAVFRDICCDGRDNVCYLLKKYELLNNLKYYNKKINLYENDMEII